MMRLNGMHDLSRFTVFLGKISADTGMRPFYLVINRLADIVQETCAFGLLDIKAKFRGHDAA